MPNIIQKASSLHKLLLLCPVLICLFTSCSHAHRPSDEIERRQGLSRDDLYTVEVATFETLETAMSRLDELSRSFPQYKSDLHLTTIKSPDGKVLYAVRCGIFIRNLEASDYFAKFKEDTGLENSRLCDAHRSD